ncbi:hypothetical protein RHMOL_Rhmol04G0197200 [Rhododendron molle]|uniref:Uncharacterized protein n=1 Tax=Rhododendron molle TaxID=49168 RepID=A0ACC0P4S5_RHOML|nr:hypothetical protein RHMOL_Rhmol04G0197200 [Rhododendron molle]
MVCNWLWTSIQLIRLKIWGKEIGTRSRWGRCWAFLNLTKEVEERRKNAPCLGLRLQLQPYLLFPKAPIDFTLMMQRLLDLLIKSWAKIVWMLIRLFQVIPCPKRLELSPIKLSLETKGSLFLDIL